VCAEPVATLLKREWPDDAAVCVRVGIHTGRTTLTETGYVGIAVHTAARVCSAGHGGQILLSSASRDALEGSQAGGYAFRTKLRTTAVMARVSASRSR
jgi:class 3 adenylate cyclase